MKILMLHFFDDVIIIMAFGGIIHICAAIVYLDHILIKETE